MARRIRPESVGDHAAIDTLLRNGFQGEPVDAMVAALRAGPTYLPDLALVAVDADLADRVPGGIAGFVMLTTVPLELSPWRPGGSGRGRCVDLLCLSPLVTHPAAAGRGMGRALVEQALARAAERGREPCVVVEGDPALYRRFGFVAASSAGLLAPSERIPAGAFQVHSLGGNDSGLAGRVLYPPPFWEEVTPGPPFEGITWLDELDRQARAIEAAAGDLDLPLPSCPGWAVGDLLTHLGAIHRVVLDWLTDGRRPRTLHPVPGSAERLRWYAEGWRALHERLGATRPGTPTATWCPWDSSNLFWRRRMVHEHAIHALDLSLATGGRWSVPDDVALDGVDEALRLWLGTRLGTEVGGSGEAVRLVATGGGGRTRSWTVVMHQRSTEIHELELGSYDAVVSATPSDLYRWVWGRGRTAAVTQDGDDAPVAAVRTALTRATG
jgi:uncharacterized protein (TIGR03083 family)